MSLRAQRGSQNHQPRNRRFPQMSLETAPEPFNSAGAWSVINQWLLYLRSMGKSVIIVHHNSKRGTQRGTSHRSDNLDTIINLNEAGDNGLRVAFEKHRNFGSMEAKPVDIDFKIDDRMAMFARAEHEDEGVAGA
jgi:hypothetical protein